MADFRKWLLAFAVAALLFGLGSSTAYAQGAFTCNTNAGAPTIVRSEGVTELVGDLILNCTGGTPTQAGQQIQPSNVQVSLNTNITSRIVRTADNTSEAILMIDEPFPGNEPSIVPSNAVPGIGQTVVQSACLANNNTNCAIISLGVGIGAVGNYNGNVGSLALGFGTGNHYNIFQGFQSGVQAVSWNGVPIDAPGTAGTRVIRITNIRANACMLGVSSTLVPTEIFELIGVNGSQQITINNPNQIVALVQPGLVSTVGTPGDYQQCTSVNSDELGGSGGIFPDDIDVAATEGFAYSFKPRSYDQIINQNMEGPGSPSLQDVPGFAYHTESGFRPDASINAAAQPGGLSVPALTGDGGGFYDPSDIVGLASQGTQLQFTFANVGAGVNLFVPNMITLTGNYGGGTLPGIAVLAGSGGGVGLTQLTVTGTTAVALYEIYYSDASVLETADVPVEVAYISNTANNLPATGKGTVAVNFAPLSNTPTASASAPIPRFCQPYTAVTLYTISPCTCDLLFPFVTNQAGFDTGIAIANTSLDQFGTTPQQGTITLQYYGSTTGGGAAPPNATTTSAVPAGQELILTLSNGGNFGIPATPGFQGYMIAVAQFQYCHAFAFISDVGAQKLAEGYLAISLDVPFNIQTLVPSGNSRTNNYGENEGH